MVSEREDIWKSLGEAGKYARKMIIEVVDGCDDPEVAKDLCGVLVAFGDLLYEGRWDGWLVHELNHYDPAMRECEEERG